MEAATQQRAPRLAAPSLGGPLITRGLVVGWLSIMVLLPLAVLAARSTDEGLAKFWEAATSAPALEALQTTVIASLIVCVVNVVAGTAIAWTLVRDEFPGKRTVNSLIDLPFALPTIVAGLTLLAIYGEGSPIANIAYTDAAVVVAMLFVTLPFVVRAVQPTLIELDRDMEDAAASLGAGRATIFRRIVLPNLMPAILAGAALAFARAIGEFGALVLIAANIPVASLYIFNRIESGDTTGATAVSVVLLLISLAILLGIGWLARRSGRPGGLEA